MTTQNDVITKEFMAKKPNGTRVKLTVRYDRKSLMAPVYLLRSE